MDDLVAAPGMMTDIILVDAGAMFTGLAPIVLNEGQRLLSASVLHMVDTAEIGALPLPGTDLGGMTIIDMSTGNAVVIANNTEVSGFTITNAGDVGIYGDSVTGFDINHNVLNGANYGLRLAGTNSGMVSDNMASGNTVDGFLINNLSGGTVSGNMASINTGNGFFISNLSGGTVSDNTASGNTFDGFFINNLSGGTVSGNMASINTGNGFFISTLSGGMVSDNMASGNTIDGFRIGNFTGGNTATFMSNEALNNTLKGYNVLSGTPGTGTGTNTGSGNGSDDTF